MEAGTLAFTLSSACEASRRATSNLESSATARNVSSEELGAGRFVQGDAEVSARNCAGR